MKKPMAYITAAWSNNEFEVTETAAKYCRKLYEAGYTPICPPLYLPLFLCDGVPQEHKDGIDMARDMLRRARVLIESLCSTVSVLLPCRFAHWACHRCITKADNLCPQ